MGRIVGEAVDGGCVINLNIEMVGTLVGGIGDECAVGCRENIAQLNN